MAKKIIGYKVAVIDGEEVLVSIMEPGKARGSNYKKPWTCKSKNYKRNGNLK